MKSDTVDNLEIIQPYSEEVQQDKSPQLTFQNYANPCCPIWDADNLTKKKKKKGKGY